MRHRPQRQHLHVRSDELRGRWRIRRTNRLRQHPDHSRYWNRDRRRRPPRFRHDSSRRVGNADHKDRLAPDRHPRRFHRTILRERRRLPRPDNVLRTPLTQSRRPPVSFPLSVPPRPRPPPPPKHFFPPPPPPPPRPPRLPFFIPGPAVLHKAG